MIEILAVVGFVLWLVGSLLVATRLGTSTGTARARLLWLTWGVVVTATIAVAGAVLHVLVDWPRPIGAGFAFALVVVPLAVALGRSTRLVLAAERAVVATIVVAGIVGLVATVYLIVVIGLGRVPDEDERATLVLSMAAAALACVLAFPARRRLEGWANQRVYGEQHSPDEALRTFGGRMSRAVPMDELLLQLVESLRKTMHLTSAEVWTGTDGDLARAVSMPEHGAGLVSLDKEEVSVVARARAQGNAWIEVWAPALLVGREDATIRSVSIAHLGELLGLIVVERARDDAPFSDEEDRVLVELARQVGLALHNVRLDSALQASLDELQVRNAELIASRARIVAAADESRRQIERNLHDGAQQHLVALAVKIGLVKTLLESDPDAATDMLDDLRADVQTTLAELRELAHGIYPPLLRDRGLAGALQTAANRATVAATIEADDISRYPDDVEAAVYFCCLEALQNAGKHAGDDARVRIALGNGDSALWFEVRDDGAGFDPAVAADGHGFVNMRDRLGAFGGTLDVESTIGCGTTVRGSLPVAARADA